MPFSRGLSPRDWGARGLESGRWDGSVTRLLASAVEPLANRGLVRTARVPEDVAIVCVGGATLGGSGKTPLAIACARALSALGARVALVGHAYRARQRRAMEVSLDASIRDVGDEAVVCARALAGSGARVVVGPTRQAALDLAVALEPRPSVVVLDGPLRLRDVPRDRSLSLLALDPVRPWGSGQLFPAGDLKAPRARLLEEADRIVPVDPGPRSVRWQGGAQPGDAPLSSLRGRRVGLFTALARPDRLVRALAEAGVRPSIVVSIADHGPVPRAVRKRLASGRDPVDAWVGTTKCALHLEGLPLTVPRGVLCGEPMLRPALLHDLATLVGLSMLAEDAE